MRIKIPEIVMILELPRYPFDALTNLNDCKSKGIKADLSASFDYAFVNQDCRVESRTI